MEIDQNVPIGYLIWAIGDLEECFHILPRLGNYPEIFIIIL